MVTKKVKKLEEGKKEPEGKAGLEKNAFTLNSDHQAWQNPNNDFVFMYSLDSDEFVRQLMQQKELYRSLVGQTGVAGANMGGTANILGEVIGNLSSVQADGIIKGVLEKRLGPIESQLKTAKLQVEESKEVVDKLNAFLEKNFSMIIQFMEFQAQYGSIKSEVASLRGRVESLDKRKEFNWNKGSIIVTIVIACLSLFVACVSLIGAVALHFIK
jgi:hypothetical protein